MTDEEISNLTTIDAFIQRKQPFAVYRIPGEKVPRLLTQAEGGPTKVTSEYGSYITILRSDILSLSI